MTSVRVRSGVNVASKRQPSSQSEAARCLRGHSNGNKLASKLNSALECRPWPTSRIERHNSERALLPRNRNQPARHVTAASVKSRGSKISPHMLKCGATGEPRGAGDRQGRNDSAEGIPPRYRMASRERRVIAGAAVTKVTKPGFYPVIGNAARRAETENKEARSRMPHGRHLKCRCCVKAVLPQGRASRRPLESKWSEGGGGNATGPDGMTRRERRVDRGGSACSIMCSHITCSLGQMGADDTQPPTNASRRTNGSRRSDIALRTGKTGGLLQDLSVHFLPQIWCS